MPDRLLPASLFGGASVAFWAGCALLVMTPEVVLRIGGITTVGAMAIGAVAAPHLARFARRATEPWRSIVAGAVLTGGLYVLSACVLAVLVLFAMKRDASISAGWTERGDLALASLRFTLWVGLYVLPLALPFGIGAAWAFFRLNPPD